MDDARILGIDVGSRRIGLALTDPQQVLAQPYGVVEAGPQALEELATLVQREGVRSIVVGLPRRTDGTLGPEAERAQAFGRELKERTGLSVAYADERFTTTMAERALIDSGMRRKKRRQVVDQTAAALILQAYLEQRVHSKQFRTPAEPDAERAGWNHDRPRTHGLRRRGHHADRRGGQ